MIVTLKALYKNIKGTIFQIRINNETQMNITGTHINYYRLCKRKLWLFANDIQMEHTSDIVADGKVIEEESYQQRSERYTQIELSVLHNGINLTGKIDFYDTRDKIVHETKRSNKVEDAHIWQVKFYLWLLWLNEIEEKVSENGESVIDRSIEAKIGVAEGLIEYPRLRKTESVILLEKDISYLEKTIVEIKELVESKTCPPTINAKICKSCSYYDFCYAGEIRE